jgi:hypothetical protein
MSALSPVTHPQMRSRQVAELSCRFCLSLLFDPHRFFSQQGVECLHLAGSYFLEVRSINEDDQIVASDSSTGEYGDMIPIHRHECSFAAAIFSPRDGGGVESGWPQVGFVTTMPGTR